MDAVFCKNGHSYDPEKYSSCPYCGVQVELGSTRPYGGGATAGAERPPAQADATRAERTPTPKYRPGAEGETVHVWKKRMGGIDPVVGWLVCVEGPDRGRDFRIHTERNTIGRSAIMDIAITGDEAISRENHAILSYNPRRHTFRIAPGDGRGLAYLNDEEVISPVELKPYDRIEIGESTLLFIPFCGEQFAWPVESKAEPSD
ncbi:FHA domain-containing protein [Thiohalocapsa marina]|uniref:FHA domain-containing protein n=1 Tax=Thiohalocapsa marina TaxID=424902 RepID=A0A5M8FFI4_9GAMM|nr:FHA domain-containing protein [Thiohalocapsa marina]KAA6182486.1 FHA domain-containing protein [Thiohalocapsa marina]